MIWKLIKLEVLKFFIPIGKYFELKDQILINGVAKNGTERMKYRFGKSNKGA